MALLGVEEKEGGLVCGGCTYDEALIRICLGRTLNLLNLGCKGLRTLVRALMAL